MPDGLASTAVTGPTTRMTRKMVSEELGEEGEGEGLGCRGGGGRECLEAVGDIGLLGIEHEERTRRAMSSCAG